ncbi:HNH endonuclease [Haladaptatus halobius]|uniref:HNH endonuclease n=1 Tax=Haladaptatus halobius TaxID=2884875 RepID=UPI003F648E70
MEVHHVHRLSDGGPDDPESVIALCPNCHRRSHNGADKDEFNQRLIEQLEAKHESREVGSIYAMADIVNVAQLVIRAKEMIATGTCLLGKLRMSTGSLSEESERAMIDSRDCKARIG